MILFNFNILKLKSVGSLQLTALHSNSLRFTIKMKTCYFIIVGNFGVTRYTLRTKKTRVKITYYIKMNVSTKK